MKINNSSYLLVILLFFSCSQEEEYPTLAADFELANPMYVVDEPVIIGEVTLAAVQYRWDFGNGKTSNEQFPSGITYQQPGIYPIILTIRSVGGAESTVQKEIRIGQYHAYQIELQEVTSNFEDKEMNIYLTISHIKSPPNTVILEEVIYQSEVFFGLHSDALPISWDIENIPLGGDGYILGLNPQIRFYDQDTGDIIAQSGVLDVPNSISYKWDPASQQGEYSHSALGNSTGLIKVLFRPVFP